MNVFRPPVAATVISLCLSPLVTVQVQAQAAKTFESKRSSPAVSVVKADEKLCDEGALAHKNGRFTIAVQKYAAALKLNPKNLRAKTYLDHVQAVDLNNGGVFALQAGNFPLAIQKFEAALKVEPDYKLAKDNLGVARNKFDATHRSNSVAPAPVSEAPKPKSKPEPKPVNRDVRVFSSTVINSDKPTPANIGKNYAILVGTNKYNPFFHQLQNPIQDARDIEDILKNYYGWNTVRLENPTRSELLKAIYTASNRVYGPNDQLLVYVAGHGVFDKSLHDGAIVASDSRPDDMLKDSYVLYSQLKSMIDRGTCSKVLLTLDVCFGGSFLNQLARPTRSAQDNDIYGQITVDEIAEKIKGRVSRRLLTPGEMEPVFEGVEGGHSPLAKHLLAALREGGGKKGYLRFSDIQQVAEQTKPGGLATSFSEADDPLSDFLFVPRRK